MARNTGDETLRTMESALTAIPSFRTTSTSFTDSSGRSAPIDSATHLAQQRSHSTAEAAPEVAAKRSDQQGCSAWEHQEVARWGALLHHHPRLAT
eukprot:CAMPEP_0169297874 /NCGR_PEP_ID=MMETSP1016-20121227/66035_1 /TAXON_ID=342587 /ORGANISM="Karlodinium micrum, Strain CCMP2283" /LENGTH=94 /DNA_ID=CAMNT_0009389619 /DNA_START=186 /DNA_END=471 /DNA_ORIENTATION=+